MRKRIVLFVLILALIMCSFVIVNAGIEYRRPVQNYYSVQNPPDFSWRHTNGATYDLVVATDSELSNIKYKAEGLKKNIYNFTECFEPGIYYWSYRVNGGSWQNVYRVYVAENAYEQSLDFHYDDEEEMSRVISSRLPKKHPRMYVNKTTLRNLINDEDAYGALWRSVEANILEGVSKAPAAIGDLDDLLALEQSVKASWFSNYQKASSKASTAALLYLASGDPRHKDFAIEVLKELTSRDENGNLKWDPRRLYPWYSTTDTYGSMFAEDIAYTYDWIYDEIPEELRVEIVKIIEAALERHYVYHGNNGEITGSLYSTFVGSHNYSLNRCVMACLSIYEESEFARKLVNFHLPVMINYMTPFSYQDGADAKGMFYGIGNEILQYIYGIDNLGIVNLRNKAYVKNNDYRYPYLWDNFQTSVFGDGVSAASNTYQWKLALQLIAGNTDNPYMASVNRWLLNRITGGSSYYMNGDFASFVNGERIKAVTPAPPDALPPSRLFKDAGYASLNSSLSDETGKISMRFKSSTYGSYNHAHPDQNAFVIDAFGENLAIDSDYYYLMGNAFDKAYNRKTWVHNSITYDKGNGQAISNSNAAGNITAFSSHPDIDIIKGEAAKAYNINDSNQSVANLSKADRTVIYLRPDVYIVVDDLESANGAKSFEFWLNTQGTISTDATDSSVATIRKNNAYLFADVVYPAVTNRKYSFIEKPDGTYIDKSAVTDNLLKGDEPDNRIAFITDAVTSAKMVTVLSLNNKEEMPLNISSAVSNGIITINAGENTVYINNTGNPTVSVSGLSFTGDAAVIGGGSYTLVNGTYLKKDGITYISSDVKISATAGKGTVALSSRKEDAKITVYTGEVSEIHKTEDEKEFRLSEGELTCGVKYENEGDYTTFEIYPESYTLNLNDTLHEGYVGLKINANEGGTVSADTRRVMKGGEISLRVIPNEGYILSSLTLNGETIYPDHNGRVKTGKLNADSVLEAEFAELVEEDSFGAVTFPKAYTEETKDGKIAVYVFGRLNNYGILPGDFGILYSFNKDFTMEDVETGAAKMLPFDKTLSLHKSMFGINMVDRRENLPEYGYARAYMMLNGKCYLGDTIDFSLVSSSADATLKELEYNGGKIYPDFSSDVYEYMISSSDGSYGAFEYKAAEGAAVKVIPALKAGENTIITVTAANGNMKTYSFRAVEETAYSAYYSAVNASAYVQRGTKADEIVSATFNAETGAATAKQYVYLYNYKTSDLDTSGLLRFKVETVNPFAERIFIQLAAYNAKASTSTGFDLYAVHTDYQWSETEVTYNNTFGNGTIVKGEKLYEYVPDENSFATPSYTNGTNYAYLLPEIDVTESVKQAIIRGEEYVNFYLVPNDKCWEYNTGGTLCSLIIIGRGGGASFHTVGAVKPRLYWENNEDRKLHTLSHSDGKLFPEFSPDVTDYIISSGSSDFSGFSYTVSKGTSVTVKPADGIGKTTTLTVKARNGKTKVYNFKFVEPSEDKGSTVATKTVYVSEGKPDTVDNAVTSSSTGVTSGKTFIYVYNSKTTPDTIGLMEFDISDVSPFAEKITLQLTCYNTNISNITGYNVYLSESEGTFDPVKVTYNNTYGNGSVTDVKLLSGYLPDEEFLAKPTYQSGSNRRYKLPPVDITKEVKEYLAKGKTKMYFSIRADEEIWNTSQTSGLRSIIFIGSNNNAASQYKPNIIWE